MVEKIGPVPSVIKYVYRLQYIPEVRSELLDITFPAGWYAAHNSKPEMADEPVANCYFVANDLRTAAAYIKHQAMQQAVPMTAVYRVDGIESYVARLSGYGDGSECRWTKLTDSGRLTENELNEEIIKQIGTKNRKTERVYAMDEIVAAKILKFCPDKFMRHLFLVNVVK